MTTLPTRNPNTLNMSLTTTDREVSGMLDQVQRTGGFLARWRVSREVDAQGVELVREAIQHHIAAKRDELVFRIALNLDEAKKRAIAENMARVTDIDREIARITAETIQMIESDVFAVKRQSMEEEVSRENELKAMLDAGRVAPHRSDRAVADVRAATDRISASADAIAEKLIQNLGNRIDDALANHQ